MLQDSPLKVHITGVCGLIGNLMYKHLTTQKARYDVYGSGRRTIASDRTKESSVVPLPDDHFMIADLSDADAVAEALSGMDAVLHIGAVPDPGASFEDVLSSNVRGTYNVLEACRKAGIKRLVYASSIMVSWGYAQFQEPYIALRDGRVEDLPDPMPVITRQDPPRPTEPYSASKVWGEGICRTYSDAHGISTVCLRIGWVNRENEARGPFSESIWCSHHDIVNIVEHALIATKQPLFEICYAVTDHRYRWVDLAQTRKRLGYDG